MINIGERLKFLRSRMGCSQDDLSEKSGIARNTIIKIEQNGISPKVETLQAVLRSCAITLEEFFCTPDREYKDDDLVWKVQAIMQRGDAMAQAVKYVVEGTYKELPPAEKAPEETLGGANSNSTIQNSHATQEPTRAV